MTVGDGRLDLIYSDNSSLALAGGAGEGGIVSALRSTLQPVLQISSIKKTLNYFFGFPTLLLLRLISY